MQLGRTPEASSWTTRAQSSSSLEKVNCSLVTHSTLFNKCRNRTFFAWKVNGRSGVSSRHIAGNKELFLPLLREISPNARKVRFSIHFSTQKKGLFHACVEKILEDPIPLDKIYKKLIILWNFINMWYPHWFPINILHFNTLLLLWVKSIKIL